MSTTAAVDGSAVDLAILDGTVLDGQGSPRVRAHVGVTDGVVTHCGPERPPIGPRTRVVDAAGAWVMPGFVDVHTHYDAEVLVAPSLSESARHGVTTVVVGNCSLSTVYSSPLDVADLFSRVEALPREAVIRAVSQERDWATPAEWARSMDARPLGVNVASFLGHSDLRASVMGLGRSTDPAQRPTRGELRRMETELEAALDAGFLGISTMTNPWDKLDGDRYRSRSLPSTYASWGEFRRLHRILRRRDAILQSIPNLNTRYDMAFFLAAATGIGRKPLKTSLLAAADPKSAPMLHRLFGPMAWVANRLGRGQFRWQHLPTTFQVHSDGIDLVVFEEFGSGRAALHLQEGMGRDDLLADPTYREWFRRDFEKKFTPRVWHRDFEDAWITECPDARMVGRSIADIAAERGTHVVDTFLDLVVEHGRAMRWHTTVGNARPRVMDRLVNATGVTVGFSDAGAHLRNMAFYNFGLRLLERVRDAERGPRPFLTLEQAVHKLTGELGDFYNLDAGVLAVGRRADIAVVDPAGLEGTSDYHEADMPAFGLSRMVNRNEHAVRATVVGGRVVAEHGEPVPGVGEEWGAGRFLPASTRVAPRPVEVAGQQAAAHRATAVS